MLVVSGTVPVQPIAEFASAAVTANAEGTSETQVRKLELGVAGGLVTEIKVDNASVDVADSIDVAPGLDVAILSEGRLSLKVGSEKLQNSMETSQGDGSYKYEFPMPDNDVVVSH
ncbi:hypothetical protein [Ruminococcus sp.]|uniref:hypothetical protein n=1 Tax=Ruminococcus sp. TaxID=41978 RepID=UPI0025F860E1|nr:hypothetical protein [Ruminococcus sp.]MBQ8967149.1 hypothetical protein [Ruminococcus sp.]